MDTNLLLSCLVCCGPFIVGAVFGGWFSGRIISHGLAGAFVPDFVRDLLERFRE